jgi:hypothetical protein
MINLTVAKNQVLRGRNDEKSLALRHLKTRYPDQGANKQE